MSTNIDCEPIGVSRGRNRFPSRLDAPKVKAWRCNLTAISQQRNLYFVACSDEIYVYEPSFPLQELSTTPDFVICPPISARGLSPGIDYDDPHSVTRLSIDHLGRDEILLIACDDGDVVGYWVKDISRAVERERDARRSDSSDTVSIKHFFHHNAGASAWGLAVHREARMLAISSNTHNVLVFAFALAQPRDQNAQHDSLDVPKEVSQDFPSPRKRNHTIVLKGKSNIPSISFNNTGEDPTGRWLSSGSIDGKTMLWDLHKEHNPARTIQVGFCASTVKPRRAPSQENWTDARCLCLRPNTFPHGTWGAMFLDVKAAFPALRATERIVEDMEKEQLSTNKEEKIVRDMNYQKRKFKNTTITISSEMINPYSDDSDSGDDLTSGGDHVELPDESGTESDTGLSLDLGSEEGNNSIDQDSSDYMSVDIGSTSSMHEGETLGDSAPPDQTSTPSMYDVSSDSLFVPEQSVLSNAVVQPQPQTLQGSPGPTNVPAGAVPASNSEWLGSFVLPVDVEAVSTFESLISLHPPTHYSRPTQSNLPKPYLQFTSCPSFQDQQQQKAPYLIITKEEIYLMQRPLDSRFDYVQPVPTIHQPLHPAPWSPFLGSTDRMCFFTQVPDLGIFVVASPIGRAAIFSITRVSNAMLPRMCEEKEYGFQLEFILPFEKKDHTKIRHAAGVGARLAGIAVGPMQGSLDLDEHDERDDRAACVRKRWRLMMYYTDHTVVSYEVSRKKKTATPDLDELIV